ncbi:ABC transporter permease [Eisenibacter elegans]|jgi:ABC-2 type transport system permease protein|uniref:ABC transporter permease n=1 Tax=Eisenibacter elegans TaxID=997 RepID=UPI00047B742E|nr:ABC transporter permease [Eisenibacter elegans]
MKLWLNLILREFRLFWQNSVLRIIFLGAPLLYGLLLGAVYQKGTVNELPIIVIDEDQSPLSRQLIDMLQDTETLVVKQVLPQQALAAAQMPSYEAMIVIPSRFEADILYKRSPELMVEINTANILTANYASKAIQTVLATLNAGLSLETLKKQGKAEAVALQELQPIRVFYHRRYNESANYAFFLYPGILATVLQQVLLLGLALSFAAEWEHQRWQTMLLPLGKSAGYWWLVKVLPYLLMAGVIWLFYGILHLGFHIPLPQQLEFLSLAALLLMVAASGLGVAVSALIPNQLKATELLMVIATPSFVLSGFTYPLSQMPLWLQYVAQMIPLTPFLQIYRTMGIAGGTTAQASIAWQTLGAQALGYSLMAWLAIYLFQKKAKAQLLTSK